MGVPHSLSYASRAKRKRLRCATVEPKETHAGWMAPEETLPVLCHRAPSSGVTGSAIPPRPPAMSLPASNGTEGSHRGTLSGLPLTGGSNSPRGGRRGWHEPPAPRPGDGSGGRCCSGCCPGGAGGMSRCGAGGRSASSERVSPPCPLPVPSSPARAGSLVKAPLAFAGAPTLAQRVVVPMGAAGGSPPWGLADMGVHPRSSPNTQVQPQG